MNKQMQLSIDERISVAIEYCKETYLELENNRTIPGTPRYYCDMKIQDHLRNILEILD